MNQDPFLGWGTTAQVSNWLGRDSIGIELNADDAKMAEKRGRQPRKIPPKPPGDLPGQKALFEI